MTRPKQIARAGELRAQGLTYAEIGARLGVDKSAVWKWLHQERAAEWRLRDDPDRTRRRAWEHSAKGRGTCARCGRLKGFSSYKNLHCHRCRVELDAERVDARGQLIVAMWAEDRSRREIAAQLGWTTNHVSVEVDRLRKKGYDLPKRPPGGLRGRTQRVMEEAA